MRQQFAGSLGDQRVVLNDKNVPHVSPSATERTPSVLKQASGWHWRPRWSVCQEALSHWPVRHSRGPRPLNSDLAGNPTTRRRDAVAIAPKERTLWPARAKRFLG